jgi:hypothetical protein
MAAAALFIALGGTSYAAVSKLLPKNSVGSAQVINGSLRKADLSKSAAAALRGNSGLPGTMGPAGPAGSAGATGPAGPSGPAGGTGPAGPPGQNGTNGAPGATGATGATGVAGQDLTVSQPLRAGQTETGTFVATGNAAGFSAFAIDFRPNLPSDIPVANAHYLTGGTTTAECPGMGQAAAGHLCVYQAGAATSTFEGFFKISSNSSGSLLEKEGVLMFWTVTASESRVWGTWAVRAS